MRSFSSLTSSPMGIWLLLFEVYHAGIRNPRAASLAFSGGGITGDPGSNSPLIQQYIAHSSFQLLQRRKMLLVEHLLEPLDEDGPIKCPVLDSFPLLDQNMWKEVFTDGLHKRKDPFAEREHVTQSSSKRRHHSPGCVFICVKTQLAYFLTL